MNLMSVLCLPVGVDAPGYTRENMTGQIRNANPSGDQETGVVCDIRQARATRRHALSNKCVTCLGLPGCRTEQQGTDEAITPISDQIFEIFPNRIAQAKVVMLSDQALENCEIIGTLLDLIDRQRQQRSQ